MKAMYDDFAKKFSASRENMKWGEIDYFISLLEGGDLKISILDIGCGNGRLLESLPNKIEYLGIDNSKELLISAQKFHPDNNFQHLDMLELNKLEGKYDYIFFIASFHHLQTLEQRRRVLDSSRKLLNEGGKIFMTNWALDSDINKQKYQKQIQEGSENIYGGKDYNIKFGESGRFYHCFTLSELEFLFTEVNLEIEENRLFDNEKNFISRVKK